MCRMVGYIGPALAPVELLQKPPHSLYVQREDEQGIARFREIPAGHLAVARRGSEPRVETLS